MPHFGTIYHGFYIYIFNTGKPGIYVIGFVIPGLKKVWSFADKAQNLILYMHLKIFWCKCCAHSNPFSTVMLKLHPIAVLWPENGILTWDYIWMLGSWQVVGTYLSFMCTLYYIWMLRSWQVVGTYLSFMSKLYYIWMLRSWQVVGTYLSFMCTLY